MGTKKSLNDHLFDQLERLSDAKDNETLDLEINKAASVIAVSEQIVSVGRLKMDLLAAGADIKENFKELDEGSEKKNR